MKTVNSPRSFGWHTRSDGFLRRRWLPFGVLHQITFDRWDLYLLWPAPLLVWRGWWGLEPWHILKMERYAKPS